MLDVALSSSRWMLAAADLFPAGSEPPATILVSYCDKKKYLLCDMQDHMAQQDWLFSGDVSVAEDFCCFVCFKMHLQTVSLVNICYL
jgi:hypothetical protein